MNSLGTPSAAASATAWLDKAGAIAERARKAFDSRARRERVLMIGAAIAVAVMLSDTLWITPAFKQWSQARARHAIASDALQRLNEEIARQGSDARAFEQQLQRDVAQMRERVQKGDTALHGGALIAPGDMLPVLDHLLTQVGGLKLRSMQSLGRVEVTPPAGTPDATTAAAAVAAAAPEAASAASAPADTPQQPAGPVLYRHGVELTVDGSYADLLTYLKALEAMPQRVLWGGVELKVEQHPKATLTLRLYTLSLSRTWLEI
jgi:MSHA biogenesis protein MshJ